MMTEENLGSLSLQITPKEMWDWRMDGMGSARHVHIGWRGDGQMALSKKGKGGAMQVW